MANPSIVSILLLSACITAAAAEKLADEPSVADVVIFEGPSAADVLIIDEPYDAEVYDIWGLSDAPGPAEGPISEIYEGWGWGVDLNVASLTQIDPSNGFHLGLNPLDWFGKIIGIASNWLGGITNIGSDPAASLQDVAPAPVSSTGRKGLLH